MSERRWNPVLGEWTITATHRQDRTFLPPPDYCPLCPTRPGGPPTEIDRSDFGIAVFDNRFPSLTLDPPIPAVAGTDLTPVVPATGACEVIVYTPDHDATMASIPLERIRLLVDTWAERTLDLGADERIAHVFPFENRGQAIGVTLDHPHGQLYAYPTIPPIPAAEAANGAAHLAASGRCLWCDLLEQERADGRRIVFEYGDWVAGVPFFARWPFEIHLTPRRHVGWLSELTPGEADGLAAALRQVARTYDALFGFTLPYIMAVHQRPVDGGAHDGYHLHVEFYPPNRTATKLKHLAGSEAGAGAFINDTLPEETAVMLREVSRVEA